MYTINELKYSSFRTAINNEIKKTKEDYMESQESKNLSLFDEPRKNKDIVEYIKEKTLTTVDEDLTISISVLSGEIYADTCAILAKRNQWILL